MVERNVTAETIRMRTAWVDQLTKCSACTTLEQWLFEVSQYLATPQYARAHVLEVTAKTKKPKKIVWKPDPDSYRPNVTLLSGTSRIVPEGLYKEIMELRKIVQYDPQIYKVCDDIWLVLSLEQIKVGAPDGGGNTCTEPGLVIRIAHEFKIKSLVKPIVKLRKEASSQKTTKPVGQPINRDKELAVRKAYLHELETSVGRKVGGGTMQGVTDGPAKRRA